MPLNVIELVKAHEGFRGRPYCDRCGFELRRSAVGWYCGCYQRDETPGALTIGYGHNLDAAPLDGQTATRQLVIDLGQANYYVNGAIAPVEIGPARFDALTELAFMLGVTRFREFKEMIAAVRAGDWTLARNELLRSELATQLPDRTATLANMLMLGVYPEQP